jgi:hypothetical protein
MKRSTFNISVSQILSVLLLVASLTVMGNRFAETRDLHIDKETTSQETEKSADQAHLVVSDAIQTSFQVDLSFHSFLLDVVSVSVKSTTPNLLVDQFIPSIAKNFKILLRRIISTNAP